MKKNSFKKNLIFEGIAFLFSVLSLLGWFTGNFPLITMGLVVSSVLLVLSISPKPVDVVAYFLLQAAVACVGGLIIVLVSDMGFLEGAITTLCWELSLYSLVGFIVHCVLQSKVPKTTAHKAVSETPFDKPFNFENQSSKANAKQATAPQPKENKMTEEEEREECSRIAWAYYKTAKDIVLLWRDSDYNTKKAHKVEYLQRAMKYAKKAHSLGDKSIGLLIEEIEDKLMIIEDEY